VFLWASGITFSRLCSISLARLRRHHETDLAQVFA
jgi:hypothetical protein